MGYLDRMLIIDVSLCDLRQDVECMEDMSIVRINIHHHHQLLMVDAYVNAQILHHVLAMAFLQICRHKNILPRIVIIYKVIQKASFVDIDLNANGPSNEFLNFHIIQDSIILENSNYSYRQTGVPNNEPITSVAY